VLGKEQAVDNAGLAGAVGAENQRDRFDGQFLLFAKGFEIFYGYG